VVKNTFNHLRMKEERELLVGRNSAAGVNDDGKAMTMTTAMIASSYTDEELEAS